MGSISNFLENELLDHIFGNGYYSVPTIYIALSTEDPTEDGSGLTEPLYLDYSRVAHSSWNVADSRAISNSGAIRFANKVDGDPETITHFAIMDALSGGNILAYGSLDISKFIVLNSEPTIVGSELEVSILSGGMGTFLANELLDHVFGNGSYAPPSIYIGLSISNPTDSGAGILEPENEYSRAVSSSWSAASGGLIHNAAAVFFPPVMSSWGNIVYHFFADAETSGNLLFYGALDSPCSPRMGDTVFYTIDAIAVTLE